MPAPKQKRTSPPTPVGPVAPLAIVGLGPLGRRIAADAHRRGTARVVAAFDHDPELAGAELGELVPDLRGGSDAGVRVRSTLGELGDWSGIRCAVVASSSDLELCQELFRECLGRGVSVASTCEELSWPWLRHPVLAQELDELAIRNGARVLGTGINPGFLMDALPAAASMLCHRVDRARIERFQDAATRRVPFQRKIGVGLDTAAFEAAAAQGSVRHVGLGESLHLLAHALAIRIESWEETIEPVLAVEPVESALGRVPAGAVRGVRQVARGSSGGEVAIELVFQAALAEPDPRDRIVFEGDPPVELILPGGAPGDVSTSAVVLNALGPLLRAQPGLHTMTSIPLPGCGRAASR